MPADEAPTLEQLEEELNRIRFHNRYKRILRSTIATLVVVAAISILIATLFLPVLEIYGDSMAPTLREGEIVVSVKSRKIRQGDVIAFYFNNRVFIKRVIGLPGQWIYLDETGNVTVDGVRIEEPYLATADDGSGDLGSIEQPTRIDYPYQVPENEYFVLGDHRAVSVDSRNPDFGCVDSEDIVGVIVFSVWPLSELGFVR